ncbi:MAG: ATP-binding cassette domain-containing protein [Muricomes sp.]
MITVRNLTKKYKDLIVLDDLNLEIEDGQIFGLVGVSGVGKSTLLGCLNGLESYCEGSISVDGTCVEELRGKDLREFRKNMGMIFQNFSLIGRKTIYQNIAFPMECWGYNKSDTDKRVRELAHLVGIEDKLDSRPHQLSGGQKQRAAIARALTLEPRYILCDECTSSLDPATTGHILDLLESINEKLGITVIMVTHEMTVIKRICRNIAILEAGRIVETGKVSELFKNPPDALLSLLGKGEESSDLQSRNMLEISDESLEQVTKYLDEHHIEYRRTKGGDFLC